MSVAADEAGSESGRRGVRMAGRGGAERGRGGGVEWLKTS